jgi:mono/diheme cytochrome c family protein
MTQFRNLALALGTVGLCSSAIAADETLPGNSAVGRAFVAENCTECHAIEARPARSISPAGAPSFLAVANDKTTTGLGLGVFLITPHATMPNIIIGEQDRQDIVAYIMSLRNP